ncbi:MAG: XRE family transcriptional regulator, partial [Deltaproteobacteria bacterium]
APRRSVLGDRSNRGGHVMKTRISKILYDKGWTEMELSRRTGLAQSYINRVKNARIVPTVRTALKICRALGVAVEDAFVYEEKPFGVTRRPYFPVRRFGASASSGESCDRETAFQGASRPSGNR